MAVSASCPGLDAVAPGIDSPARRMVYPGMRSAIALACLILASSGCAVTPMGWESCERRAAPGEPRACFRAYCRDSSGRYVTCPERLRESIERYRRVLPMGLDKPARRGVQSSRGVAQR